MEQNVILQNEGYTKLHLDQSNFRPQSCKEAGKEWSECSCWREPHHSLQSLQEHFWQHPEEHFWGVHSITFLALGSFSRTRELLTSSCSASGYPVYLQLGTAMCIFLF